MSSRRFPTELRQRYESLCELIESLYPADQAKEIIASFESAFVAHRSEAERRELIDYWLDFYRLQAYRKQRRRRRPTPQERSTPCAACGYPSSHRHHLWDLATHGENKVTVQLCANCHELHHLMYNALVKESEYSRAIVRHVMASDRVDPEAVERLLGWCLAIIRYEADNGWIDGAKGSREAVEEKLDWSAFLKRAQSRV
ncbi:hypothetical protein FBR02_10255 [Anaerolineae bacterium CFX9]|jgi:ribosomal protein L37E|nr:hypothetical protein [Anaerolineae bacterium CFX9]